MTCSSAKFLKTNSLYLPHCREIDNPKGGIMSSYDILCIFDPKAAGSAETTEKVESLLAGISATVEKKDDMGTKPLSYPINKRTDGHYCLWTFTANPDSIKNLDKELRIDDKVLRHLITRNN